MEGNNPSKGNTTDSSMASGPSASMSNTKLTSETLRLELREGEKQNHMQDGSVHQGATLANPALQKKKTPSFQITSVVYNVDGEESPDETEDMSDILDTSKMTDLDQETPSFSEEYSKSEDAGAPAAVIPTSSQYGITAVVQQNESGGLLTSRLPHGITVNVTKGGIALAEADGVVTSDTENLSNRFKIVKIASNKPFKKGRWVCFDFMDSPATSAVGIRNTESNHGVSIPLALVSQGQVAHASQSQHPLQQQVSQLQQGLQLQTPQIQQQFPISSQAGNTQQVSMPFTSQVPPQGYHSNVSNQPGSMSVQQVSQMSMQQQHQQQHQQQQQHQLQQHLQQQQLQQQIQQNQPSVLPSQALENRQTVVASSQQPSINTNLSQSSPVAQGLSAVNIIQQQIQNQPQEQQLLQQATSQQSLQTQMHPQSVMTGHMASGQQMTQQQMQPSSSHTQQQQFQSQINQQQQQQLPQQSQQQQQQQQQQMQHQIQQQMQQQLQHQQSIPSQSIGVSQGPQGQDNLHLHKDPSPSAQPSNSCYQTIQQQQLQGSQQQQPMALSQQPTSQQLQQQQQGSSQVQLSQQNLTASPSACQVSLGGSSMSTNLSSYPSVPGLSSVANLSNINISKMITSHITATEGTTPVDSNEAAAEHGPSGGDDVGPGDEEKQSASTASTVAIDNKIEQAMDLVKSHLMFAVREEVDVLKERIGELMERINHLEYENTVLRKYATQEALQQIQQQHGGAPNP